MLREWFEEKYLKSITGQIILKYMKKEMYLNCCQKNKIKLKK